jgi:imidazolonepropionase-like amidohydrolase
MSSPSRDAQVKELLRGSIDPHIHSGPSLAARGIDHIELLKEASEAGMAAVVTKDHDYSGVVAAQLIAKHYAHLPAKLYSGIVLNNAVGGFNPYAVEHTAALGGKIVWMPTMAAENHLAWEKKSNWSHPAANNKMRKATAVLATENGRVLDEVKEILDIIAKNDMVLAAGHLHVSEIWLVFEEAKRRGVNRLVVNHPEEIIDATMNDVGGLVALGAWMEHSLCMFVEGSKIRVFEPAELRKHIEAAGVDKTIMSTDLGQTGNITPTEGFRRGIALCLDLGYSPDDVRKMFSTNAAKLLGLEDLVKVA